MLIWSQSQEILILFIVDATPVYCHYNACKFLLFEEKYYEYFRKLVVFQFGILLSLCHPFGQLTFLCVFNFF